MYIFAYHSRAGRDISKIPIDLDSAAVLPRGRNLGRKAQKGPKKIWRGPGKSGAELLPDLSKKGRKGAELFLGLVFNKITYISCQKLGL
jgi:hypothetical protein